MQLGAEAAWRELRDASSAAYAHLFGGGGGSENGDGGEGGYANFDSKFSFLADGSLTDDIELEEAVPEDGDPHVLRSIMGADANRSVVLFCSVLFCSVLFCSVWFRFRFRFRFLFHFLFLFVVCFRFFKNLFTNIA